MTKFAKTLKALGNENRIKIIELLEPGNVCACELLESLQVTQPTLSHHMKILVESGLVTPRKDGKWVHYSINKAASKHLMTLVNKLFNN